MVFKVRLAKIGRLIRAAAYAAIGGFVALGGANAAAPNEKRVALVIGNGNYRHVGKLQNPLADAKSMAVQLKALGFDVIEGFDLGNDDMFAKINEMRSRIEGAKAAILFYAGHGIAVGGENYMLPVDIEIPPDADEFYVKRKAIRLNDLVQEMQGAKGDDRASIVILDACRDNPLVARIRSVSRTRNTAIVSGLSEIKVSNGSGVMIAFSTAPGQLAQDGKPGGNSPFTASLLRQMSAKDVNISTVFDRVRADVHKATNGVQMPWTNSGLIGEFYLNPRSITVQAALPPPAGVLNDAAPSVPQTVAPQADARNEGQFWESVDRTGRLEEYRLYLETFPNGQFAALARTRIVALQDAAVAQAKAVARGTPQTQRDIGLRREHWRDLHRRLEVIGHRIGRRGDIRQAVLSWQQSRQFEPTGYLNLDQYKALIAESDPHLQRLAAPSPDASPGPAETPVAVAPPPPLAATPPAAVAPLPAPAAPVAVAPPAAVAPLETAPRSLAPPRRGRAHPAPRTRQHFAPAVPHFRHRGGFPAGGRGFGGGRGIGVLRGILGI